MIVSGEAQFPATELIGEGFVEAVIARERFRHLILFIDPMRLRSGNDPYLSFLSGKRAGQLTDQFQRCVWRRFFVICAGEA